MRRQQSKIIEICGGIASGKTTFANLLQKNNYSTIYESFTTNPFWEAFYSDSGSYIFETEITFTLQHYHQIKTQVGSEKILVCDYSFLLDLAYAEIGLTGSQLAAFKTVYTEIKKELPPASLIIHLQCRPRNRVGPHSRSRSRGGEEYQCRFPQGLERSRFSTNRQCKGPCPHTHHR